MDENIETLAVQHQPRHDVPELLGLEDNAELRDRVRAYRLIAESPGFDGELIDDRFAQAFGGRPGGGVVVDVSVVAFEFGHRGSSPLSVRGKLKPALDLGLPLLERHETGGLAAVLFSLR